jgi:transposase-like protein
MQSEAMKQEEIEALAREMAKGIKTEADLEAVTRTLTKTLIETALKAEMTDHLGYEAHDPSGAGSGNSRNGTNAKTVVSRSGPLQIETPRDRNGEFDPQLVKKRQRRVTVIDDKIIPLYAKGMSTREIAATIEDLYGAEVSASLISKVTEAVVDEVIAWQARPLDSVYAIVYLDGLSIKVRHNKQVINKTIYLALGLNMAGEKELLGLWIAESEGAKFWLQVLTELRNRGVGDILIACVDGLTGFPDAIESVYPQAKIQLCIVHMMRNSLNFVAWKDRKLVAADLKRIYKSTTVDDAEAELDAFCEKWDSKFPSIGMMWRRHWPNLITIFNYPPEIRKVIYTTNAIESLNSVIRKSVRKRKLFPSDTAALKVVYLSAMEASKHWKRPVRDWKNALNQFAIQYDGELNLQS